jgi:ketosteroid isomerase-like protein
MGRPDIPDDHAAIRAILAGIAAAWRGGRFEDLRAYFSEDMVIVPPGFASRVEGREACLASYRDFVNYATITEYRESEPTIDVRGEAAVATFGWEMAWEVGGRPSRESGHDLFVFAREDGRWLAVYRTLIPAPGEG